MLSHFKKTWRKRKALRAVVYTVSGLSLIVLAVGSFFLRDLPSVAVLKNHYPVFASSEPEVRFQTARPYGWTSLSEISQVAVQAIRLSEDWGFYGHEGIDVHEIKESIRKNLETGRYARGASTITQQVARNLFLSHEKTLRRKIREILLARRMEKALSKQRIMEIYLNIVDWGDGVRGIGRAAALYFHTGPQYLRAKEGAFLAMLLPNPHLYASSFRDGKLSPYARKTMQSILRKLVRAGYLSEEEARAEESRNLWFEASSEPTIEPYFERDIF